MAGTQPESSVVSGGSDDLGLSFDFDQNIDAEEYSRIMRRIVSYDETPQVAAFNSAF
jgi:hypothetical protein